MLSWLVSLAAHVAFRRRADAREIATLPLRSPAGAWASVVGFTLIIAATLKTWCDSRVNLFSGALYLVLLTAAYFLIRAARRRNKKFGISN
jgi:L-asparagine transporter-like permease